MFLPYLIRFRSDAASRLNRLHDRYPTPTSVKRNIPCGSASVRYSIISPDIRHVHAKDPVIVLHIRSPDIFDDIVVSHNLSGAYFPSRLYDLIFILGQPHHTVDKNTVLVIIDRQTTCFKGTCLSTLPGSEFRILCDGSRCRSLTKKLKRYHERFRDIIESPKIRSASTLSPHGFSRTQRHRH